MPEEIKRKRGRPPKNKSTTAPPIVETNNVTPQDSPIMNLTHIHIIIYLNQFLTAEFMITSQRKKSTLF